MGHMLQCMKAIASANQERAHLEETFLKGEAEFLPQFRSFQALYNSKIQQQQNLSQELRKHQHSLRDAAPADTRQRGLFENLRALLEHKALCCREGKNTSNPVGAASTFDAYGATNIMTLK